MYLDPVPTTLLRPYRDTDLPALIASLQELCTSTGFPPRTPCNEMELSQWILHEPISLHYVLAQDDLAVGQAQVFPPRDYLLRFLRKLAPSMADDPDSLCEIGKIFVGRSAQGQGLGTLLMGTSVGLAAKLDRKPVLTVLPTWHAAFRMYERFGFTELGRMRGKDGINIVMTQGE